MKDKCFIFYANPCITCVTDPGLQNFEDAQKHGPTACRFYPERKGCGGPDLACVQLAGTAMARYVLQFYSEATEETLAMEREHFRREAPLPPNELKAYIDTPEFDYRRLTDADTVVQRVWEVALGVLDLRPGDRVLRDPEETWSRPVDIEADLEAAAAASVQPQAAA